MSSEAPSADAAAAAEPKTVLMATVGSRGDVQPFIAIAQVLVSRGVKVVLCAHTEFREFVEFYGILFEEIGNSICDAVRVADKAELNNPNPFAAIATAKQFYSSLYRSWYDDITKAARIHAPDLYIFNVLANMMERVIKVSHGAPSIVVHATPSYPTWEFLCFTLAMGYTAKLSFLNRLSWYVGDMVSSTVFSSVEAHIVAERAVAIPSSAPGMDVSGRANSAATLFIYSERIVPRPKEWVETNIHITGTVTLESRRVTSIPEPLQEFIRTARKKSGDAKLAYIGLGSMLELYVSREKAPSVMSILATAAQAAGCWTIVSTLGVPDLQVEVPHPERAFFTAESLPHDALFALCDVAAHHGGAGTTHAVARGGASSVVIPCVVDQPFWGGALHHKGAAAPYIHIDSLTLEKATQAFEQALRPECRDAAKKLGEALAKEDGKSVAADVIMDVLTRRSNTN